MMNEAEGRGRFRPGFVFKDGKGYEFERDRLTVMRPWPAPAAWRLTAKAKAFRHVLPKLDLAVIERWARPEFVEETVRDILQFELELGPTDPQREERLRHGFGARHASARAFLDAIPEPVRAVVRRFDQSQWQMLTFLGRVPGGLGLARTNPALAYALALNPAFHRPRVSQPLRAARTWAHRPRHRIAGWLGFPETSSAVKLLAKVDPGAAGVVPLFTLRRIAREGGAELATLQHLPRIHAAALECVGRASLYRMTTGAFVGELARLDPRAAREQLQLLQDTRRMIRWIEGAEVRVRSIARLRRLHDDLVTRVNQEIARPERPPLAFPLPPIPGTAKIEPVTTSEELRREGREMQHCVASFEDWVAAGQGYVYRVLEPERATLSLEPDYTGTWRIAQLHAVRNQQVEPETEAAVRRWLAGTPEPREPVDLTPMFPQFIGTGLSLGA